MTINKYIIYSILRVCGLSFLLLTPSCAHLKTKDSGFIQLSQFHRDGIVREAYLNFPIDLKKFTIIGHRGACGYRPEHTIESYALAIDAGADFVEPDLVVSKDGVIVIRHEYEIGDTTNVSEVFPERRTTKNIEGTMITGWFIEDFTLPEIKRLRAKERLPYRSHEYDGKLAIVTFEEFLQFVIQKEKEIGRKIGIYPEIKHSTYFKSLQINLFCSGANGADQVPCSLETKVLKILEKYGYGRPHSSPVIIQSFEVSNLQEIRKQIGAKSSYKLLQLLDEPQLQPADLAAQGSRMTYGDMLHPEMLKFISEYADGIGPWKRLIIPEDPKTGELLPATSLVGDAHKVNLFVHAYTFRSDQLNLVAQYRGRPEEEYWSFMKNGVDGVFSDFAYDAVKAKKSYLSRIK